MEAVDIHYHLYPFALVFLPQNTKRTSTAAWPDCFSLSLQMLSHSNSRFNEVVQKRWQI